MKKIAGTFLLLFTAILVSGRPAEKDSLKYEVLLTGKMLRDINLNEKFIRSFDVTSSRLLLLSTGTRFYLIGWGGIQPIGQKLTEPVGSFAYTPDGILLSVRKKEVCYSDSSGNLKRLFGLPGQDMGITAGKYVMYFYNRNKADSKYSVYAVLKGGKYSKLVDVPAPVNAVCEFRSLILFASENAIYSFNPESKEVKAILVLSGKREIQSLTVDSSANRIYFSTGNSIYALKDTSLVTITKEVGGILKYFRNGLLIFNPEKNLLIRMDGIGEKITSVTHNRLAASKEKQKEEIQPAKENPPAGNSNPSTPGLPKNEPIAQPAPVPAPETGVKPSSESNTVPAKDIHLPAGCIRVEKFISNATGDLVKGRTYILKKDFSQPIDFLNTFPEGSILKLVGTDPGVAKSWKVIKPSDGSYAFVDPNLYIYFEQAHVWLIKQAP